MAGWERNEVTRALRRGQWLSCTDPQAETKQWTPPRGDGYHRARGRPPGMQTTIHSACMGISGCPRLRKAAG